MNFRKYNYSKKSIDKSKIISIKAGQFYTDIAYSEIKDKSKVFEVKDINIYYRAIPIKLTKNIYVFVASVATKAIIVKLIDENKYTVIKDKNLMKEFENERYLK